MTHSSKELKDRYIKSIPSPLSKEEQMELAKEFIEEENEEAGKKLIETNLRYVLKIASNYNRSGVKFIDLVQAGNLGLQKALYKFDPDRGVPFINYAYHWIRAEIGKQLSFEDTSLKIKTRSGTKIHQNIHNAKEELRKKNLSVTNENLAEVLDEDVEEVRKVRDSLVMDSLDEEIPWADGRTRLDMIENENRGFSMKGVEDNLKKKKLYSLLEEYEEKYINSEREKDIWENRIATFDSEKLRSIGDRWDVSKQRINQVEHQIKDDLKDWLEERIGSLDRG